MSVGLWSTGGGVQQLSRRWAVRLSGRAAPPNLIECGRRGGGWGGGTGGGTVRWEVEECFQGWEASITCAATVATQGTVCLWGRTSNRGPSTTFSSLLEPLTTSRTRQPRSIWGRSWRGRSRCTPPLSRSTVVLLLLMAGGRRGGGGELLKPYIWIMFQDEKGGRVGQIKSRKRKSYKGYWIQIYRLGVCPFILIFLQSEPQPIDLVQSQSRLEEGRVGSTHCGYTRMQIQQIRNTKYNAAQASCGLETQIPWLRAHAAPKPDLVAQILAQSLGWSRS